MATKETIVRDASEFYAEYDEHGNLSPESKKQFDKNGFLTFPQVLLMNNEVDPKSRTVSLMS